VTIEATNFFFRVKLEWHPDDDPPATVLEWTNQDIIQNLHVGVWDTHQWALIYDNVNVNTRDNLTIGPTEGNLLQQIEFVTFVYGTPLATLTSIAFETRDADGDPIDPADGDVCWIEVRPSQL
jgi:hypothetical protein